MSSAANIIGRITVNEKDIYEINDDPTVAPGIPAPIGSTAMRENPVGPTGEEWLKTGAADTAWSQISTGAGTVDWHVTGNILTGATPDAPNEFIGSNNDYDWVFHTNGVEGGRLRSTTQALEQGLQALGGIIDATGIGSRSMGSSTGAGSTIIAAGIGATAIGFAQTGGDILADTEGSFAIGRAESAQLHAAGGASFAMGYASTGNIVASGTGSFALGYNAGVGQIQATDNGSFALGTAATGGNILSSDPGSLGGGSATGAGNINSTGIGSVAWGNASIGTLQAVQVGAVCFGSAQGGASLLSSEGTGSTAMGLALGDVGATLRATNDGAMARGVSNNSAAGGTTTIIASGLGASAEGYSFTAAVLATSITASGDGSKSQGAALDGGEIQALGAGSMASGHSINEALIVASGDGAHALGHTNSTNSRITASGAGSLAQGSVETDGVIEATGDGSFASGQSLGEGLIHASTGAHAMGRATGTASAIRADGLGSLAGGSVTVGGSISAASPGSFAYGISTGGIISSGTSGAVALGFAQGGFSIVSGGPGSLTVGYAENASITASGAGAAAIGHTAGAFPIQATGDGSFAVGNALTAIIIASGLASLAQGDAQSVSADYGQAFGQGHDNSSYAAAYVGHYSVVEAGTPASPGGATDPLFVVGNGTSVTPSDAFKIDRDGKSLNKGAEKHAARVVAGTFSPSARTDRTMILDTTGAGAFLVNLPASAGESTLKYTFGNTGGGPGTYTLTPDGTDTLDPNVFALIVAGAQVVTIQLIGTVWYAA